MRFFVPILLTFLTYTIFGQNSKIKVVEEGIIINNTTDSQPAPTAVLDVNSSDKGAIFPRLTQVQIDQITNPDEGLLLYNKDKRIYQFYNGSEWLELGLSIPLTPPNAPSNLVASATSFDQIDLIWTDDSDDETGFEIWRSLTSGGDYELVGSVGADVSSYSNTELPTNTQYFYVVLATFNQDLNSWNVNNVVTMGSMFRKALVFNGDISNWVTSSVNNMGAMFLGASAFNQNIGGWNVSNVTSMGAMFQTASAFNQNIGSWNVSNVTNMSRMFRNADSFDQSLSIWDVSNVTNMSEMFYYAYNFNGDISGWNPVNVVNFFRMFNQASAFNRDISGWNTSNVTTFGSMFRGANSFDQDLSAWDIQSLTTAVNMFVGVTLSTANYDALLIEWEANTHNTGVNFTAGYAKYTSGGAAETARTALEADGWIISDLGVAP